MSPTVDTDSNATFTHDGLGRVTARREHGAGGAVPACWGVGSMRVVSGLAVLLVLCGCVPIPYKYYYMSLAEADGLEVVERGTTSHALLQNPVPVLYQLSRRSYFVELDLDELGFQPSFRVRASSSSGTPLLIETRAERRSCLGWKIGLKGEPEVGRENHFIWSVIGRPKCLVPGEVPAERFAIAFKVLDLEGNVLGTERLPFTVERNGFIVEFDAI